MIYPQINHEPGSSRREGGPGVGQMGTLSLIGCLYMITSRKPQQFSGPAPIICKNTQIIVRLTEQPQSARHIAQIK